MVDKLGQASMPITPIFCILEKLVQQGMITLSQEILQKCFLLIQEDLEVMDVDLPMSGLLVELIDVFRILSCLIFQISNFFA